MQNERLKAYEYATRQEIRQERRAVILSLVIALVLAALVILLFRPVDSEKMAAAVELMKAEIHGPNIEDIEEVAPLIVDRPEGEGLLIPCGLTVQELESGLLGGLKPYAKAFLQAEEETGVNAVFLAAVAALESGWGDSRIAQEKNNLFGWGGASGYMAFESKEACISKVAERIKALYLTPEGKYFNGYTVQAVNERYNASWQWGKTVEQIMEGILARGAACRDCRRMTLERRGQDGKIHSSGF